MAINSEVVNKYEKTDKSDKIWRELNVNIFIVKSNKAVFG